eukprot:587798-Pleurochrysis_carterae.AAC.1
MTRAAARKVMFNSSEARAHPATGRVLVGEPSCVAAVAQPAGAWTVGFCASGFGGVASSSRTGSDASAGSRSLHCGGGAGGPVVGVLTFL